MAERPAILASPRLQLCRDSWRIARRGPRTASRRPSGSCCRRSGEEPGEGGARARTGARGSGRAEEARLPRARPGLELVGRPGATRLREETWSGSSERHPVPGKVSGPRASCCWIQLGKAPPLPCCFTAEEARGLQDRRAVYLSLAGAAWFRSGQLAAAGALSWIVRVLPAASCPAALHRAGHPPA